MHNKEYRVFKKVLLHIALLIVVLISIFPFIWMLTGATNKSVDVTGGVLRFGKSLGENWTNLQSSANVFLVFLNSMKITLIYTFVSILICSMAGYGFEKYRSKANMLDSHTAVILPTLAMPFLVFFFRQSFQSYPTELIEAARIDGANEFTIFFRLVMAPMKSTFAAGAIYAFMKQWNNYLWPLIVIQTNEKKTFTLLLSSLASAYYVDYGQLMLAIVLATIPIIIVFLTMQKQFVEGIVGSSK